MDPTVMDSWASPIIGFTRFFKNDMVNNNDDCCYQSEWQRKWPSHRYDDDDDDDDCGVFRN